VLLIPEKKLNITTIFPRTNKPKTGKKNSIFNPNISSEIDFSFLSRKKFNN
jgi:hypothetical protein